MPVGAAKLRRGPARRRRGVPCPQEDPVGQRAVDQRRRRGRLRAGSGRAPTEALDLLMTRDRSDRPQAGRGCRAGARHRLDRVLPEGQVRHGRGRGDP